MRKWGEEIFFVLRKKEKGIFFIALHVVEKLKKKEKKKVNSQTFHRSKGKNVSFGVLLSFMFYVCYVGKMQVQIDKVKAAGHSLLTTRSQHHKGTFHVTAEKLRETTNTSPFPFVCN